MNQALLLQLSATDIEEIVSEYDALYDDEISKAAVSGHDPEDTYPTKESFCTAVLKRLRRKYESAIPPPTDERFHAVFRAAEKATGREFMGTRDHGDTLIRMFVSFRLHEKEGFSYREVGKRMNRDHSSITHQVVKMREMMSVPFAYKDELSMYAKFDALCDG